MTSARITGAAGTLLIHAALLLPFLLATAPAAEQRTPVLPEKKDDEAMRLVATPEADGSGIACEHSYRGIGLLHWGSGLVTDVAAGGPAARAGVQIGDYLLNESDFNRDTWELGKRLPLRILRDGVEVNLTVVIGIVCYEKPHTVPHLREAP